VNGYNATNSGLAKFLNFQNLIKKFICEQKELVDTGNEYFARDRDSVEDFLYEIESSYVKKAYINIYIMYNKDSASKFD
jgi:hypothetical protein